ncbi:MAG: hypothetical protein ABIJ47_06035 [Candidatus Bathyarchaeota archaeon]
MSEYRLIVTKKPTLRLWLHEGKKKTVQASTEGSKAALLREVLLPTLRMSEFMSWRDGRVNYHLEEESALRLYLAMKGIAGVMKWSRVNGYVEAVKNMDRGEVLSWYSLYLKLGFRAIAAFRAAYY